MGKLTNQLSTWRKDNVECKKGNVTTLWFKDTQPNIMFIQNDSDTDLFVSIDHIPTRNDYAFKVKAHNNRLVARPYKTAQLYILNDGGTDISCVVWSIFDTFRPEMLNDFSVDKIEIASATLDEMISELSYDGVIRGFANGVKVPEVSGIAESLTSLISNDAVANVVNLYSILNSLTTIATKVQSIYEKDSDISAVTEEISKSKPLAVKLYSSDSDTSVIKTITSVNNTGCRFRVGFISNDSENRTLQVNYTVNGATISGTTLKPSETLGDVWIDKASKIELSFSDGNAVNSDLRYWIEMYAL